MQLPKSSMSNSDLSRCQQIISRQDLNRQYKQNVSLIYDTLTDLVDFSNELGDKVDSLLQHQSVGFFNAYRSHLTTIQQNVVKLENKIISQESKIKQYQSQGTIALLLKKISELEKELNNLYEIRLKLMNQVQSQKIKNDVLRNQNLKLGENIQDLIKLKSISRRSNILIRSEIRTEEVSGEKEKSLNENQKKKITFSTQSNNFIGLNKSITLKDKRFSFQDAFTKDLAGIEVKVLKNKITNLTKQHNKLLKSNVQIGRLHSELQGFFLECVQSVKKDICLRKNIPISRLADFRKEDKTKVLNMVLQNDEIIRTIYHKLFNHSQDNSYSVTNKIKNQHKKILSEPSIEIDESHVKYNRELSRNREKIQSKSTVLPNLRTKKNINSYDPSVQLK